MVVGLLALLGVAAPTQASRNQEALFQDDFLLLSKPDAEVVRTLDTLRSLGVDRLRVTLFWRAIAPEPTSRRRPSFRADDPDAYPLDRWGPWDRLIRLATARSIAIHLDIAGPVPAWATGETSVPEYADHFAPSAREYELFVKAVGSRYSGRYVPVNERSSPTPPPAPASQPPSQPPLLPGFSSASTSTGRPAALSFTRRPTAGKAQATSAATRALPRVSFWSLWNEPNGWFFLVPQWGPIGLPVSAREYRPLVDAAFRGLHASGHGGDTILLGETAPQGRPPPRGNSVPPLTFVRGLYCLNSRLRPVVGAVARVLGCPVRGPRRSFVARHPGLFNATGWAHHPYSLETSPRVPAVNPEAVGNADVGRLDRLLRGVFRAYGRGGGLPIYLTEFGYQSRPPHPRGVSLASQAAYINEAEFMAYRSARVRAFTQFLLADTGPVPGFSTSSPYRWASFQTGLVRQHGAPKPALAAYRLPIYLPAPSRRRPGPVGVWGAVRPAPAGAAVAEVQLRGRRGTFRTLKRIRPGNQRGYFETLVQVPGSGALRIAWTDPRTRRTHHSREASVRIG